MPLAESIASKSRNRSIDKKPSGCLVLVVAAGQIGSDVLLTAARRRLPDLQSFEFPKLFTTRRNGPRDAEVAVSRETFRAIEGDGCFLVTWAAGGHQFGLPQAVCDSLAGGNTAVVCVPGHVVGDLQDAWPDLRIVRLTGGLDAARESLTPHACLRRMMGPRLAQRLEGRHRLQPPTDAVSCADGVATAIRSLTDVLARIGSEQDACREPRTGKHGSRPAQPSAPQP